MSEVLVRFSRAGGRPPADDEWIEVRADGSFSARRTIGGARIGRFAGRLHDGELEALTSEVSAARDAGELWLETPRDGATESVELGEAGEVAASLGSNARPPKPWAALVGRLRALLDEATAHPEAAVELVADAAGARLVAAGDGSLELDTAAIEVRLVRLDASGVPVWRWSAATGDATAMPPRWETTGQGWTAKLLFEVPPALATGEWLQVWVFVTLRSDLVRRGRLFVSVPGSEA